MKKIVAAWIEQILEFDSVQEYTTYIESLKGKNQKFKEVKNEKLKSGIVRLRIMKQYNNNEFPDNIKKGGEKE